MGLYLLGIFNVPMDVLREIMTCFSLTTLKACALVCRDFRRIAQDAIWADPALNADHLQEVLSNTLLSQRIRHIRVIAAPGVLLDLATTTTLHSLLGATKSHLRGLSFLSGRINRNTLHFVAGQGVPGAFRLTALRISLPSWDDIVLLSAFPLLSLLDLNTSHALLRSTNRRSVRMSAVKTFVWRHHGAADVAIRAIAAVLIFPSVEEFMVQWSNAQVSDELTAALVNLHAIFTASSPHLTSYRLFITAGNDCITRDDALAAVIRHAPSSATHLEFNCDIGPWHHWLAKCLPDTVDRVTLATTIEGTVHFLRYLVEDRQTSKIRLVTVAPNYDKQNFCWSDLDAYSDLWPSIAPRGAVFSDWTWSLPTLHSVWGLMETTTETSYELHRRMQAELRPLVAALKVHGVRVVDVVGTAAV